jgi:hypothetical protein
MYYEITHYDIYEGDRLVIKCVPVEAINWQLLQSAKLTVRRLDGL